VAHKGSSVVPPRTGATSPQSTHLAQRWEQAVHHGVPVVSEIMAGPNLAQMAQVIDF
jgi:hypothetical protein